MKKLLIILSITIILAASVFAYMRYRYAHYPERLFKNVTHVAAYTLRSTIHNGHDTYLEAAISESDKEKLLMDLHFNVYPANWALKRSCAFIPDNDRGFLYWQDTVKQKPYRFTLCFLQPKTNVVIVYEYRDEQ